MIYIIILIILISNISTQTTVKVEKVHFPLLKNNSIATNLPINYEFYMLAPLPNSLENQIVENDFNIPLLVTYPSGDNPISTKCNMSNLYTPNLLNISCVTLSPGIDGYLYQLNNFINENKINVSLISLEINNQTVQNYYSDIVCGPGKCINYNFESETLVSEMFNSYTFTIKFESDSNDIRIPYIGKGPYSENSKNLVNDCQINENGRNISIICSFNPTNFFECGEYSEIYIMDYCQNHYYILTLCFECLYPKNNNKCCNYLENNKCVNFCNDTNIYLIDNKCVDKCYEPYIYQDENYCLDNCAPKFLYNNICINDCFEYNYFNDMDSHKCVKKCDDNKFIQDEKYCVSKCNSDYYYYGKYCIKDCSDLFLYNNKESKKCEETCNDIISENDCVKKCPKNYLLYNNHCYKDCSEIRLVSDYENMVCVGKYNTNKLIEDNSIVNNCSEGYFIEGNECVENCSISNQYHFDNHCVNNCRLTDKKYQFKNECVEKCEFGIEKNTEFVCKIKRTNNLKKKLTIAMLILAIIYVLFLTLFIIIICKQ